MSKATSKPLPASPKVPQDPELKVSFEKYLATSLEKVEETLQKLPADVLIKARQEIKPVVEGDLGWADFSKYSPERITNMAELGYNQFNLGLYDSAEKIFKGLTLIEPDNYYFHQMLGAIFQRKEKFAEAIVEYSVAIELEPSDLISWTNRGETHMKLGLLPLADADFGQAIDLDTTKEDKWANRARMLKEQIRIMSERIGR